MNDFVRPVCPSCGSYTILVDAYGAWDVVAQDWVLHSLYDNWVCNECGFENKHTMTWEAIPCLSKVPS